jgi:hypothetical protein
MWTVSLALVLAAGLSGCGDSSAESAMKDMIAALNGLAESLESVKDDASADAALPQIRKAAQRVAAAAEKLQNQKVTQDEEKRLGEKYKKELAKAQERLMRASMSAGMKAPKRALEFAVAMGNAFGGGMAMKMKPQPNPKGKRK